ncbi:hypothetical protein AMECASPLE_027121 [Ameca splendens]|uniref:Uncharacterized protein n=1 Tax=Ameca splendens TaxID=208324 RepID=A0ABV0ZPY9_9TELE
MEQKGGEEGKEKSGDRIQNQTVFKLLIFNNLLQGPEYRGWVSIQDVLVPDPDKEVSWPAAVIRDLQHRKTSSGRLACMSCRNIMSLLNNADFSLKREASRNWQQLWR